jgi:Glycosyl transferase family 2
MLLQETHPMLALTPSRRPAVAAFDEIEVSVVMPCLNEARTVGRCVTKAVSALEQIGVRGEVIVADNGSTDGSQELAEANGARVVSVIQRGYGSALQAGIAAANGRYVIMGDADDSYDFSRLELFVERLRAGDDLVMGNRFRGGIHPGAMPRLHRYFGNPVMTGIVNFLFRTPIGDVQCGLRGFRKEAYNCLNMTAPGMEFASEMVARASMYHQKISEVPTVLHKDGRNRRPHLRSFRDGWRNLRLLLILCPLWLYLIPAGLLLAGGFGLMAWLTPGPQLIGRVRLDMNTMMLGALCLLLGYQTVWLWVYARFYGWRSGILPADTFSPGTFKRFNLEGGLLVGAAFCLAGLALNLWVVSEWVRAELGALNVQVTFRFVLWGFTALVLGVQTIYGSFFLSMLGMRTGEGHARGAEA